MWLCTYVCTLSFGWLYSVKHNRDLTLQGSKGNSDTNSYNSETGAETMDKTDTKYRLTHKRNSAYQSRHSNSFLCYPAFFVTSFLKRLNVLIDGTQSCRTSSAISMGLILLYLIHMTYLFTLNNISCLFPRQPLQADPVHRYQLVSGTQGSILVSRGAVKHLEEG